MQLIIKNKWVSLRGGSYVKDINGNDYLKVQGKFFSITNKKFIMDMKGEVKYMVRNKFWRLFAYSAFICDKDQKIVSTVRRKIFSLHDSYKVESPWGEITFVGNILGFDYHICLNGKEVGHIARKISMRDSFVLDIKDDLEDPNYFVALVIALDNITDRMHQDNSSSSSD